MEKYTLFFILALIAEIIGTVSGFGSSILFVPIASMFFDFKLVLGITAVFHVFSNLSKIFLFRDGVDKNIILKLGVPAVVFVIIGALLSNMIPQKELELLMSFFLIIISALLIIFSNVRIESTTRSLVSSGILSGFLAGIIGTGGAIRGLVLSAFHLEKTLFVATSAMIDLGVDFSRAVVYTLQGYLNKEILITIPILIGISFLGSWLGKLILIRIPQVSFRYIVLGVIITTSIIHVIRYFYFSS